MAYQEKTFMLSKNIPIILNIEKSIETIIV